MNKEQTKFIKKYQKWKDENVLNDSFEIISDFLDYCSRIELYDFFESFIEKDETPYGLSEIMNK